MHLKIIEPGPFSTVQDIGRRGFRGIGVPQGGAVDSVALRIANLLVGNPEGAAAIECTLGGPELEFSDDTAIAVGGASFAKVPSWQRRRVRKGERLKLGWLSRGCRAYLAVAGGVDVAAILGSRATCISGEFGGCEGRALKAGDFLPVGTTGIGSTGGHWIPDAGLVPEYSGDAVLRVVPGDHAREFRGDWVGAQFRVSPDSNRMGIRLSAFQVGPLKAGALPSAPVAPGTVQVPPDGMPIVLLADAQTLGGYPRLAHVITVDQPVAAQLRPGDRVRFQDVTLEMAHSLLRAREERMCEIKRLLS